MSIFLSIVYLLIIFVLIALALMWLIFTSFELVNVFLEMTAWGKTHKFFKYQHNQGDPKYNSVGYTQKVPKQFYNIIYNIHSIIKQFLRFWFSWEKRGNQSLVSILDNKDSNRSNKSTRNHIPKMLSQISYNFSHFRRIIRRDKDEVKPKHKNSIKSE